MDRLSKRRPAYIWPYLIILFVIGFALHSCSTIDNDTNSSPSPKYSRKFYRHWIDADHDCQNTRAEVLISSSLVPVKFKAGRECLVVSGKWQDPYSGKFFTRAKSLDIDHIVPLKAAHSMGASSWSKAKRERFANDSDNLLAVSASLNRRKGAKSPGQWMPPNPAFGCEYLSRWKRLMIKYDLTEPTRTSPSRSISALSKSSCTFNSH